MPRILVIEPYFGGSHKQFIQGLLKNIEADFTILSLPARKWKMRMQLSAPWFAGCIREMKKKEFDTVLCSTFVDVAVLKALLSDVADWKGDSRFCTYFHENQFVYPNRQDDASHFQFTAINFTTALTSDRLAFNSHYNWQSFITNVDRFLRKSGDIDIRYTLQEIEEKSVILYPALDFPALSNENCTKTELPVICWNHRWEHDKNPKEFFRILDKLALAGYDFRLVVLGQSFSYEPEIFTWARQRFKSKILHFGYVESKAEYFYWLQRCHIVISTALHEFFGISVIEAVWAGCVPLVPDRLSYPELYPSSYRYGSGELFQKLKILLDNFNDSGLPVCEIDSTRFSWKVLKDSYEKWLLI